LTFEDVFVQTGILLLTFSHFIVHRRLTIFYVQPHATINVHNDDDDEDVDRFAREMLATNKLDLSVCVCILFRYQSLVK